MFLRNVFRHNYQLVWDSNFQDACTNFPPQFSKDEFLPFIASSGNSDPSFYDLRDFAVTHFDFLTYDTLSINKSLEPPPPIRPHYTYLPQMLASDTTSDVSLQTITSASNVLVNTHSIGNLHPNLNTPPLPPTNSVPILIILSLLSPLFLNPHFNIILLQTLPHQKTTQ